MSASSKKKLRKEQASAQLTKKQQQAKAEAKKLKTYTTIFVSVIALVLCITLVVLAVRGVEQSGILQNNTVAVTIGDHELSTVDLNYFLIDMAEQQYNSWYQSYSTYTNTMLQIMYGLDPTKSLDRQVYDTETGDTWADYFIDLAIEQARDVYALYDKGHAEGYELPEDQAEEAINMVEVTAEMAELYGFDSLDDYLVYYYGYGADEESYTEYMTKLMYAECYSTAYYDSLEYEDEELREYEKDRFNDYTSYTFSRYYLNYNSFLGEGTKDEDGNVTHTDEEKDAARAAAKAAAESLVKAASLEELDKLIAGLEINKDDKDAASTKVEDTLLTELSTVFTEWLSAEDRKEGDIAVLENATTTENEDGTETKTINGYYVVYFHSSNENNFNLANVRHLLIKFEGATVDPDTGETVYSDEVKNAAEEKATELYNTWKNGEATEESFIKLVKEHSDDGTKEEGGLYEDIAPNGSYVEAFENWATDQSREAGDAEVIETEYGYHVMYYVGDSDITYRNYMITNDITERDYNEWHEALLEKCTATKGNTSRMNRDIVLSVSYY